MKIMGMGAMSAFQSSAICQMLKEQSMKGKPNIVGEELADDTGSDPCEAPRDSVFAMMHSNNRWVESRCVRTEQHKLIRNFSPSRLPGGRERPVLELYDLRNDPFELENAAGQAKYSGIQQELA